MPAQLAWLVLFASILFEIGGMIFMRYSNGFAHLLPSAAGAACFLLSIYTFSVALKHIEMGISYAIWASVSTAALTVIGMIFYAESASTIKIISIVIIIFGVVLLNLTAK